MDKLTGSVERVTYYNAENGYGVYKITPDSRLPRSHVARDGTATVVGTMPELNVGEDAEFTGTWIDDARYGMQLRVETVTPILPSSEQGITRYLASGIVRGIGEKTAEKIVDHFGIETINILNREPHRLHEVPGLKTSLADDLAKAWAENHAVRQTMIFLQGYGVTSRMAHRIHDVYGTETINAVKENPYALADEVFGIGFLKADQIARNMGMELEAPERIRAGLRYALNQLSNEGHTFAPRELLVETVTDLLQLSSSPQTIIALMDEEIQSGNLVLDTVWFDQGDMEAIYLPGYYRAEVIAAERLRDMANMPSIITETTADTDWDSYLAQIARQNEVDLTEQQQSAVHYALSSKVSVLTGGPGTGKTTTLRMVIAALEDLAFDYALASPTGRAAKRLAEATGQDASTLHRLLGFRPGDGFEYDEDSPLKVQMLIVDEASMIDLQLFSGMLRALGPETHLMLVGDVDQLPSVGAGNVLRDVINSRVAYVTRLDRIFRQDENSHIIVNAHRINSGDAPFMDNQSDDFYFFGEDEPLNAAERVVDVVKNRIPRRFGYNPMEEIQVIAPMYRGPAGVNALNTTLQEALNNERGIAERKLNGRLFRVGDKVMQTRNNYEKEVFNGDIGHIRGIDEYDNLLEVVIDGRVVDYQFADIDELAHAYCITIHKSQGSEYPVVVIPLLTQHYMMLQRNLLYTAITRAREMVVLVGNRRAVHIAVKNNQVSRRYSGLLPRLTS